MGLGYKQPFGEQLNVFKANVVYSIQTYISSTSLLVYVTHSVTGCLTLSDQPLTDVSD